jgi:hypothetical protein
MIEKVEVRTIAGTLLTLSLEDISNGYAIEEIRGLDPVKATIVSSDFAQMDGSQYQTSSRGERNLVFTIGFEPDYSSMSVRSLRTNMYSFFMPKSFVNLRFYMVDGLIVETIGRVESFEAPLFTDEPKATISVLCFDPDFIETTPIVVTGNTTSSTTEFAVTYEGTTDTGFIFVLSVDRTLTEFSIYHHRPDGSLQVMDFAAALAAGDVVTVSTINGDKRVTLTRSGSVSSLLYGLSPQSPWLKLQHGVNNLRVHATGAAIPFTITYNDRYGGL